LKTTGAKFILVGAAAALIAAIAATLCIVIGVPIWAMFLGWAAFDSRGHAPHEGIASLACLALGIAIGLLASAGLSELRPISGAAAEPLIVLVVTLLVVSLRAAPRVNNVIAYFLGLTGVFASNAEPALGPFVELCVAGGLGGLAGWLTRLSQAWIARRWPQVHTAKH
jgi:hypothetical protein